MPFLQHAPSDLRGGTFLQHPRTLIPTINYPENPHRCLQILHAAMFQVLRGAYTLLRVLPGTESPPVAQNEAPILNPVSFVSETTNDEIAVDVPLPEEPTEVSGWITEEAFFSLAWCATSATAQGSKDEPIVTAKVLSLEETAQARARWPDRAMDTRWARSWKPDDSKPSGRRAKARLIIKGFTDPDLQTSSHILRRLHVRVL